MLAFQSVEDALASGFVRADTASFDHFKGFELVSAPQEQQEHASVVGACLVASAVYSPLVHDVLQLEIDGCAKFDHLQASELRGQVFGCTVEVLIGPTTASHSVVALFSPTNLLKAIKSFREAVDLFYAACPAADEWEQARVDALNSIESGKAARSREQSIRYALSIRKKFGFENLEAKYQKILKDNGLV